MDPILKAYRMGSRNFNIEPLSLKRDWMDATPEKHAYHCYPVSMANTLGWVLSCPEDISFVWNGVLDTTDQTVEIIKGADWCYTGRGQASVSFKTGLLFRSNPNISLLAMTPPNYFYKGFEVINSLISTSFYRNELPLAIQARIANEEIVIPAGSPIATILPISLTSLKDQFVEVSNFEMTPEYAKSQQSYGEASFAKTSQGEWTDWYRDALNEKGEKIGEHEVKNLRLRVVEDGK
jgi:hypothetical protein